MYASEMNDLINVVHFHISILILLQPNAGRGSPGLTLQIVDV